MANKDELIAKLGELGKVLGRELSTEGTIEVLNLRIREAEEEIVALEDDGDGSGSDFDNSQQPPVPGDELKPGAPESKSELMWVKVRVLTTLHINALHETRNQPVKIAYAGDTVRIPASDVDDLEESGLATAL
ncbi:TPA: DNA-packaging protein FI [Serratia odorifera]